MKRLLAAAFFILLPVQGFAKDQLRKFRWSSPRSGKPQQYLGVTLLSGSKLRLLPGVGEFIASEQQTLSGAKIQGTWKQTIFNQDGSVSYLAGEVIDGLPSQLDLKAMQLEQAESIARAHASLPELQNVSKIFPASLELYKNEKSDWVPVWRIDYLNSSGDRLRYLLLSREGKVVSSGSLEWDGADGRALVFPKGPKMGAPEEVALHDLSGDGTISGRLLKVLSALDLKVWSPELTFFFSQDDRRFDLGQAYYTIGQGYRWLKERLGVEIEQPIEVKLHVGNNGVSNAAFYHKNTIYLGTGDGQVYKDMIRDPSILIHEGIHAVIDSYVGLPSEGEGGSYNEGFADLFTALILDNPKMGEASYQKAPFRRTLENKMQAYKDFSPGVYQNGSIIGATFWDMKSYLGTELTAKLAFKTMVRLGKGAKFDDFFPAINSACDDLVSAEQKSMIIESVKKRGWKIL